MSSVEQDAFAEWLAGQFTRVGSDARNVTLEAYAEEKEARALSGGDEFAPQPGFRDLLKTAEVMVGITKVMLANPKTTVEQADFLSALQLQMADICKDIFAQIITNQVPVTSGAKHSAAKR